MSKSNHKSKSKSKSKSNSNSKIFIILLLLLLNTHSMAAIMPRDAFWRTHSVMMIYASTCPYCHRQAQVLAPLVALGRIPSLVLYSVDNKSLPPFEHFYRVPNGLLKQAYPNGKVSYPALFILANDSLKMYPIAYGYLDADELHTRLQVLTAKIIHYEASIDVA